MVLGLEVKALTMVVMIPLLVVAGADAGVGVGMELVCLRLDLEWMGGIKACTLDFHAWRGVHCGCSDTRTS
jgi:hypothetical protein